MQIEDAKLSEILSQAEMIQRCFLSIHKFNIDFLQKNILILQENIKLMQSICYRLADVANIGAQKLNLIYTMIGESKFKPIDPYPSENSHAIYKNKILGIKKQLTETNNVHVRLIAEEKEIPTNDLFYDEITKEYVININGYNIKGNLCNIEKKPISFSKTCRDTHCQNPQCRYWHKYNTRTLAIGSWLYSSISNKNCRHIGGLRTISNDIKMLSEKDYHEEISNRESQLMHDILVFIILCNEGLVKKYKMH